QFLKIFYAGATTPIENKEEKRKVEILHEFLNDIVNDKFKKKYPYGHETSACKSNLEELKGTISALSTKFDTEAQK
uniref:Uncharacterized protein n=1 Tax=Romanomermis culicivorax TaxID=13658 RepID=A0A915L457_ROMCU